MTETKYTSGDTAISRIRIKGADAAFHKLISKSRTRAEVTFALRCTHPAMLVGYKVTRVKRIAKGTEFTLTQST